MRKLSKSDEARVTRAASEFLLARARDDENGSAFSRRFNASWDDAFAMHNVVVLDDVVVAGDGAAAWKVHRRWSTRKRNGCYPQLKPTFERLDVTGAELEAMLLEKKGVTQRMVDTALGRPMRRRAS